MTLLLATMKPTSPRWTCGSAPWILSFPLSLTPFLLSSLSSLKLQAPSLQLQLQLLRSLHTNTIMGMTDSRCLAPKCNLCSLCSIDVAVCSRLNSQFHVWKSQKWHCRVVSMSGFYSKLHELHDLMKVLPMLLVISSDRDCEIE